MTVVFVKHLQYPKQHKSVSTLNVYIECTHVGSRKKCAYSDHEELATLVRAQVLRVLVRLRVRLELL